MNYNDEFLNEFLGSIMSMQKNKNANANKSTNNVDSENELDELYAEYNEILEEYNNLISKYKKEGYKILRNSNGKHKIMKGEFI